MANSRAAQRPVLKVPAQGVAPSNHGAGADAAVGAPTSQAAPATAPLVAAVSGPTWACTTPVTQSLTVGETFLVSCEGATAPLQAGKIFLLAPKENPYGLKLLQLREVTPVGSGVSKISFVATTYVASEKGPLPISGYALTDGAHSVALAPLQLQSHSVITQDKNPERKPFGPFAPLTMGYPLWLWILLALILASLVAAVAAVFVRRSKRRKFMLELSRETSVLSPYNQFNKELRGLGRLGVITDTQPWTPERAKEMLTTLRSAVLWYVAREFEIPAHTMGAKKTLRALGRLRARKLAARFKTDEKEIATTLRELERALTHPAAVSHGEILQLSELCRNAIERLNKWPITRRSAGARP